MVTATGAKAFYLYKKVNGRPQRIRIGGYPEITIDQARTEAQVKAGEIAKGVNPMAVKREARIKGMNLGELWAWFFENWAKPRKRSWRTDEIRWGKHLKQWSARELTKITTADVAAIHLRISKATTPATANRVLALLKTMFNKAKMIGWKNANPCVGAPKFEEHSRERFLATDEINRLFEALDSRDTPTAWRDFFKVALFHRRAAIKRPIDALG